MTSGVYAIVNTTTGKAYVGSSFSIGTRWCGRRSELNRGVSKNKPLQTDWSLLGATVFELRVLEVVEKDDAALMAAEKRWIDTLREAPGGVYNQRGANVGRHGAYIRHKRRGWGWVARKRRAHYFIRSQTSVCGNAQQSWWTELEDDLHDSPDNCAACMKIVAALPKKRHRRPAAPGGEG